MPNPKGGDWGSTKRKSEEEKEKESKKKEKPAEPEFIEILGRGIPAVKTPKGLRAAIKGEAIHAASVETYLKQKFKDDLDDASHAMEKLAKAYPPKQLESKAYDLYEKFRPEIPEGTKAGAQKANWIWTTSARWQSEAV